MRGAKAHHTVGVCDDVAGSNADIDRLVVFDKVSKSYSDRFVVTDVSFEIRRGEFFVLVGPSGSGKTTLLRMINRMVEPTKGSLFLNGRPIGEYDQYELRRSIGYVIQSIGLFPHMTVAENVATTLRLNRWPKERIAVRVREVLQLVRLDPLEFSERYPRELSGGQQQRVGIARALAADPSIVLMDEPFSALDPLTRDELQREIREIQRKLGKTVVFVTHDLSEALRLADRICIMNGGRIEQLGAPTEVLLSPASEFVEKFLLLDELLSSLRSVSVGELMISEPIKCKEDLQVSEAKKILIELNISSILVVDGDGRLVGLVTQKDLLSACSDDRRLSEFRTSELFAARPFDSLAGVLREMRTRGVSHVPVVSEQGEALGLITKDVIVEYLTTKIAGKRRN